GAEPFVEIGGRRFHCSGAARDGETEERRDADRRGNRFDCCRSDEHRRSDRKLVDATVPGGGVDQMAYWMVKTEPEEFSWVDQVARGAKGEPWSGVRNFTARRHLKAMKKGELAFFYHTGTEKQVVGIVEVIREAYPDRTDSEGVFVAVDMKAVKPFPQPVTLA